MAKRHKQIRHRGLQFTGREFRPYATTLGQLLFAWNDLHEQLAAIYWTLAGYSDDAVGEWNKPTVDKHKRDLIRRWVNALPATQAIKSVLRKIHDRCGRMWFGWSIRLMLWQTSEMTRRMHL
jgi:hypothetical protein